MNQLLQRHSNIFAESDINVFVLWCYNVHIINYCQPS